MTTLEDLIEACCEELRRGVTPDLERLAMQHPEVANDLRRLLPTLLAMEDFAQETTGLPPTMEIPLPLLLGNDFRLERRLGYGGMGTVFEAQQLSLARRCAVKVLARHLAAVPHHREAFIREARTIANLHHPHIVKVFSAGETDDYAYYAMELLGGDNLERVPPPNASRLIEYALQAATALAYAHQCGIIHCDIKPSNLLLDDEARLRIGDFGLARLSNTTQDTTEKSYSGGTRAYMAPECQHHQNFTAASDQYAFGVTFQTLAKHLHDVPRDLTLVLRTCCAIDPEQRYASMDDVAADLRRILVGEPVSVRTVTLHEKLLGVARKHPIGFAMGLLLGIGLPTFTLFIALAHRSTRHALATSEANLAVADTVLATTFEYIGENNPTRNAATLLNVLIPYYRDIIQRRDTTAARMAAAEATLAEISLRTGDYSGAVNAYRRYHEVAPTLSVTNQLADALLQNGEETEALTLYREVATHVTDPEVAHQIEAIRALCALGIAGDNSAFDAAAVALSPLLESHASDPDVKHLRLLLREAAPTMQGATDLSPTLEAERLALATAYPNNVAYGLAALTCMTRYLQATPRLQVSDEPLVAETRHLATRLLAQGADDPKILLATVRFAIADSNCARINPHLSRQAQQAAEHLSGALEVLFAGSSLPEDMRNPLFESLFGSLLETRLQNDRKQAARLRQHMRDNLPPTLLPPPKRNTPFPRCFGREEPGSALPQPPQAQSNP